MKTPSLSTALLSLGRELRARGYEFTTPTPETHRRVRDRDPSGLASDLRDVFGWNRPFRAEMEPELFLGEVGSRLFGSGLLAPAAGEGLWQARVRYSTLDASGGRLLLAHSGFPTEAPDSVFFGPDTYRFARFLRQAGVRGGLTVDIGAGSGAGGLTVARDVDQVILTDINPRALEFCRANAELNDLPRVSTLHGKGLAPFPGGADWIIANPPYLVDPKRRTYRDGGGALGAELSLQWAGEAIAKLRPGGRFVLYTGSAIERGRDAVLDGLRELSRAQSLSLEYSELDPDVFGEELENEAYSSVERIAAIGAVLGTRNA